MIVLNLFSGPGAGKSTTAADLFQFLKKKQVKCELVGEEAKELIYRGGESRLANQMYLAAMQYSRLKNLEWSGCDVAIADSPLLMNLVYAVGVPYYEQLRALTYKLNTEFDNINLYLDRGNRPYSNFGRTQKTVEEAKEKDVQIFDMFRHEMLFPFYSHEDHSLKHYVETKLRDKGVPA